jgi:hypothetical protein
MLGNTRTFENVYHKLIELAPNKSQKLMVNRKIKKV